MTVQPEPACGVLPAVESGAAETFTDREARNPFFRYLMHLGVPLTVSVGIHAVLLALLAYTTFQVLAQPGLQIGAYGVTVTQNPSDRLDEAFRWDSVDPLDTAEEVPPESLDELTPSLADFSAATVENTKTGQGVDGPELGLGKGTLSLYGTGVGSDEPGSAGPGYGPGAGGGIGRANPWKLPVVGNRIVYVVDLSGSIIVAVDALKRELKRDIGGLKPSQSFDVIVFYGDADGARVDSFRPGLVPATEEVRREFSAWIAKQAPRGDTQPLEAVKRALALQPDAVVLISDGQFSDPDRDEAEISRLNGTARARIYCVVFDEVYLTDTSKLPPKDRAGSLRLRRIAEANRGTTTIVTGADLAGP